MTMCAGETPNLSYMGLQPLYMKMKELEALFEQLKHLVSLVGAFFHETINRTSINHHLHVFQSIQGSSHVKRRFHSFDGEIPPSASIALYLVPHLCHL